MSHHTRRFFRIMPQVFGLLILILYPLTLPAHEAQPNSTYQIYGVRPPYTGAEITYVEGSLGTVLAQPYPWYQEYIDWIIAYNSGPPPYFPIPCPGQEKIAPGQCTHYPATDSIVCAGAKIRATYCNGAGGTFVETWSRTVGYSYTHKSPAIDPGCTKDKDTTTGNPCDASNGNKYQHETDYNGGSNGLSFSRHYNSVLAGWTHNYNRRVTVEAMGTPSNPNDDYAAVLRDDGYSDYFWYRNGARKNTKLNARTTLTQTPTGWVYRLTDGRSDTFNTAGQLQSAKDTTGRLTTFTPSANRLVITSPSGHTLTLDYDALGRLASLTTPTGAITRYTYDANNNPISVTYPDSMGKRYHYENSAFIHHLTGISLVDTTGIATRYSTYGYDTTGRAILTQHAQTSNGAPQERFTLRYDSENQTTVTDAANTQQILSFYVDSATGIKNLIEKRISGDSRFLQKSYDANRNLTCQQDELYNLTTYTYNAFNQRTQMTEGNIGGAACPYYGRLPIIGRTTTYQYLSPTLDIPTVIESPSVAGGTLKKRKK